ncbi:TonB-dependent receptor domain-containing protein [Phascolarctobacterium succinatutens]|uniref:TonB-dependent receptor domain-containing protein n=1 Tax=Phascolarctobacterium succinatutens TaxID=626940 RepID=UPI0026EBED42|nr:TonB-dependent receptor [Phascolarctobacterium succinatutens]MBS5427542.1 TonB-dependent receptor [Phascolarctobacterium succinatutens]
MRSYQQKKWQLLAAGVLMSVCTSCFTVSPVWAAEYTKGLTGNVESDMAIIGGDGNTVVQNGNTVTYNFQGKDHTFTVKNKDAIMTDKDNDGYDYVLNNVDGDGNKGTLHLYQTNTRKNDFAGVTGLAAGGGKVVVNSNLDITAYSAYASVGVGAAGGTELTINGNVKMRKDDPNSPWGIITKNVHGNIGPGGVTSMDPTDVNYTGARWQPSAFSVGGYDASITVNGNVDVAVRGTAVQTNTYSKTDDKMLGCKLSTISLVGDSIKIETPSDERNEDGSFKEAYYAMASYGGTININVVDTNNSKDKYSLENENLVAAEGKTTNIIGNVIALKRSERTDKPDVYQDGRVNIGLTTKDSTWKGVIDNAGTDHAGEVNVWLSNGAQWTHEATSRVDGLDYSHMPAYSKPSYDNFDGVSYVNKLVGGQKSANSGFIYQNSDVKLNIANYSGYNTIVYKHNNKGMEKADFIGGDVTIQHANAGANVTLATDNKNIDIKNGDEVEAVLNALASKLTYSGYVNNERDLSGTVMIASGLTASSITAEAKGMIKFNEKTGEGGYTKPQEGEQNTAEITSGMTGTSADSDYTSANIRQEDGSYKFTQSTKIDVENGTAIDAAADITVKAADTALTLDAKQGIVTNGNTVDITSRTLHLTTKEDAIVADGGKVISMGITNINKDAAGDKPAAENAVKAANGAEVTLGNGVIKGNIISDASVVNINKDNMDADGKYKEGSLEGNLTVANGGKIDLTVADGKFLGSIVKPGAAAAAVGDDGTVNLTVADGAVWTGAHKNADAELNLTLSGGVWNNNGTDATYVNSLKGGKGVAKTIKYINPNGGNNEEVEIPVNGFISMAPDAGAVTVGSFGGTHIVSYDHDNAGSDVSDYKGGNFTVEKADKGSMLIAATSSKNIKTNDQDAVEAAFKALSQKIYYGNAGVDENLTGKTMITSGLTASSISRWIGDMKFDSANGGVGSFVGGSGINITGDYETALMKGARAATTSAMLSWRDNAANVIYRGDLLRAHMESDGIWAKTYGGKDTYNANAVDLSNSYWGAQVGFDRMYDHGWIAGAAIDYQKGSSSYNYTDDDFGNIGGNTGDNKLYSFGLYASKDLGDGAHLDFAAKAGSVRNEFSVHNGIGTELNGTYRNRGYSATASLAKRIGTDKSYLEPQAQLTWAHLGGRNFAAVTDGGEVLDVNQGNYNSLVGRLGLELGKTGHLGSVYARFGLAHEFSGDITGSYSAEDGGSKTTSVETKGTWAEMSLGTTLNIKPNASAYFDVSRSYGADYEHDWKFSGGLRFALDRLPKHEQEIAGQAEAEQFIAGETAAVQKNAAANVKTEAMPGIAAQEQTLNAQPAVQKAEETTAVAEHSEPKYVETVTTYDTPEPTAADFDEMSFELAPIVVTASRMEKSILKAKADMSVVGREEIEQMHMDNVEEVLRTVPGVQFLDYGSNGLNANMSGIRINGSKDVVILVDGVRVNDFKGAGSSGYMFAALMNNMDNIERVEVMRGSAATMYGSGAKGGVINIITRRPEGAKTVIDIAKGSFGKEAYKFNTQAAKDKVSYNIYHDRTISGTSKDGSGKEWPGQSNTKSSGAKFEYKFNDANKLTLNYETIGSNFSGTDLVYGGHYVGMYDSNSVTLKHDWQINDQWSNSLMYRATKEKSSWDKPGGEDTDISEPITSNLEYKLYSDNFKYQTDRYTMVGGIEYSKGKDNTNHKETSNTSLFLQGDWELVPHVTLSGGIRHDRPDSYECHNSISYKLGWDITEKDTLYAGRSDYYILPSLTQLYDHKYGNADLRASEGRTTSIGYNHEFTPDNYMMLSWFETKSGVGMTMNSTTDKDDPNYGQYQNSIGGISRGWNAQYNARLSDAVTVKLGWAHLFYDEKDSFTQGYAPKDKATFGVYYDKDKFSAAFDGFYFIRDKRGMKEGVKGWPSDKYGVYNLALNYTADKQTKFYVKVDNIFNKLWAEHTDVIWSGGADSWYAMPGRSFVVGMQYTF